MLDNTLIFVILMSTKLTPKGMRDISPEDMYVRQEVISKIRSIFINYGFRPLETPVMEYLSTLRAKAGEEADKQIFVIDGNEYGLRFDLTVPLSRYACATDAPKPFKRYAIDKVWRREEPQRGRFREFYQADADIIGSESTRSEAELLSLAKDVCTAFGFNKPKIMINNRKILDGIATSLDFVDQKPEVFRILDKLDKIGEDEVEKLLTALLGNKASKLLEIVRSNGDNKSRLTLAAKYSKEGAAELEEIVSMCDFEVEVDLFLVRGLGYYTGPVYEIKLADGMGTVVAGGRYDNLLGVYGQGAAAVGISVGVERLITLISEQRSTSSIKRTDTKVFVASVKPEYYEYSVLVATEFRKNGIAAETDLNIRNLRKQFDYANSLGISYVAIVGEKEKSSKSVTLRNMVEGSESSISISDAIKKLKQV